MATPTDPIHPLRRRRTRPTARPCHTRPPRRVRPDSDPARTSCRPGGACLVTPATSHRSLPPDAGSRTPLQPDRPDRKVDTTARSCKYISSAPARGNPILHSRILFPNQAPPPERGHVSAGRLYTYREAILFCIPGSLLQIKHPPERGPTYLPAAPRLLPLDDAPRASRALAPADRAPPPRCTGLRERRSLISPLASPDAPIPDTHRLHRASADPETGRLPWPSRPRPRGEWRNGMETCAPWEDARRRRPACHLHTSRLDFSVRVRGARELNADVVRKSCMA